MNFSTIRQFVGFARDHKKGVLLGTAVLAFGAAYILNRTKQRSIYYPNGLARYGTEQEIIDTMACALLPDNYVH